MMSHHNADMDVGQVVGVQERTIQTRVTADLIVMLIADRDDGQF